MIGASKERAISTIVDDQQRHHTNEDQANALAKRLTKQQQCQFPAKIYGEEKTY